MTYTVSLVRSGDGAICELSIKARSLPQATEFVDALDERWDEFWHTVSRETSWPDFPFDRLPETDPLRFYEGCDIYATAEDGTVYALDPDGEWILEER